MTESYTYSEEGEARDQYFTCPKLAKRMIEWAELSRGMKVLEPSAGDGGLVIHMPKNIQLTAVEIDPAMCERLRQIRHPAYEVVERDFLGYRPIREAFDVAVMNSPYGKNADGEHAAHALRLANRVVCLTRVNFEFGQSRFNQLWRWAAITRRVVLTRRPMFYGPACKVEKGRPVVARHDYVVLELVRREQDRIADPSADPVETEYWTDSWA